MMFACDDVRALIASEGLMATIGETISDRSSNNHNIHV